jgi:nucleoid-associated protein YgaU
MSIKSPKNSTKNFLPTREIKSRQPLCSGRDAIRTRRVRYIPHFHASLLFGMSWPGGRVWDYNQSRDCEGPCSGFPLEQISRERMKFVLPSRRGSSLFCLVSMCALLCTASLFAIPVANAQDAAEAARQEKARKAAQPQKPQTHVYTNDDLQKPQILTPGDRAPVEARRKSPVAPNVNENSQSNQTGDDATTSGSLGEVARRLRQEKAARQAEQARKLSSPSLFQLPPQITLAHPSSVAPLSSVTAFPASPMTARPAKPARPIKRDPFSREVHSLAGSPISSPIPKSAPLTASPTVAPTVLASGGKMPATAGAAPPALKNYEATVRVQAGDSLWMLSRQYLGKGSRWHEWMTRNPQINDPSRIETGAILVVPADRAEISSTPAAGFAARSVVSVGQSDGTVSVRFGDSMWKIAAMQLGSGAAWPCVAAANPAVHNAAMIYPGQSLLIPASCAPVRPIPGVAVVPNSNIPAAN